MNHQLRCSILGTIVGIASVPGLAFAQGVSVAFTNGRSGSTNGLDDVSGVQATFVKPIGERPWSVRYGVSYLTGSKTEIGVMGSYIIPFEQLPIEPINRKSRLTTVSAGIGHFAFRDRAVMMHSYADLTLGSAKKSIAGLESGSSDDASKFTAGIRGGLEAQWFPSKTLPFALQAGMAIEGVKPLGLTNCADCWIPFHGGFDIARSYVGIVVGRQTFRAR